MDIVDDVLGTKQSNNYNKSKNNYKKNSWKESQDRLRNWAYDTMEEMTQKVKNDSFLFKQYLDIQSKFEKYSVGNSLLILKQYPEAMVFKDKQGWKENNILLNQNPKHIIILEPCLSEKNGKTYYNPKEMYDVSQTNAEKPSTPNFDIRTILKGFFNNCFAEKKAVDELPDNREGVAYYDKVQNILYITRGTEENTLLKSLTNALAEIEMRGEIDNSFKNFKCKCVSYMLCKKYGIDVSNDTIPDVPFEISSQEKAKDAREVIDQIRINFDTINSRIVEGLESKNNEIKQKKKVQERQV